MASIYQSGLTNLPMGELQKLVHQVGQTPMQALHLSVAGKTHTVHLKLEGYNPTGSMKDRTGYSLIQHLEDRGLLSEGSTIIESTSGNLGVALAFQCKARGYRFIAVIDPKTTEENIAKMEALDASIEMVYEPDTSGGFLLSRLARVQELCSQHQNYTWTDQYSSSANPHIHYSCTGPEVYQQMDEQVDAVFVPVSTGGTLSGIGRFFREVSPATRIIGVDAHGSVIFGTPPAPRKLTGIGSSRRSHFISADLYDSHMLVHDEEAFAFCRELYRATDIHVGGSSGASLAACVRYLASHPEDTRVACVCADSGRNYASSIYNDAWLQQHNITLTAEHLGPLESIAKAN
ncbi:pyridoxal-phosphate dependent enzyme [Ktedonobacter robiniae]|uniref:pyridoxal-phosphate dependent enzyme n=1 Tax=Ktedonobacter robiniae TaxID=2778365 RepID=UPI001915FEDB|nr:pyridoxal-phosphate dependent enzyme [Ktedonobacter robiniae]